LRAHIAQHQDRLVRLGQFVPQVQEEITLRFQIAR